MREYNEQWAANRQSFQDWIKDGRESRHTDRRPMLKNDPRMVEQRERLSPKEPDFT